jgi:hydroxymethylglutaryl-CoA synthase
MPASIIAGAMYFPAFGEPRGRGAARTVCGADEDGVTLAVEGGERALRAAGVPAGDIDGLYVAVQNGAELVGPLPQIVREALGIRSAARVTTATADDLGGYAMLQAALADTASGSVQQALVVSAEAATDAGERVDAGAGAVVIGASTAGATLVEQRRASSLTHEEWFGSNTEQLTDVRFIVHRRQRLLDELLHSVQPLSALDGVVAAGLTGALAADVAYRLTGRDAMPWRCDFGIAGPVIAVVDAASRAPSLRLGFVAVGSGQAVLAELTTGAGGVFDVEPLRRDRPPAAARTGAGPALSLPLESPFFARDWSEMLRLAAARCDRCGHVAFPPSQRPICPVCRGRSWTPHELPRTGTVQSALENRFLPAGFGERIVFVLAELEGGQVFSAPMPPEFAGSEVAIGDPVRLALRRYSVRDGLPAYSMKFVPTQAQEAPHGA